MRGRERVEGAERAIKPAFSSESAPVLRALLNAFLSCALEAAVPFSLLALSVRNSRVFAKSMRTHPRAALSARFSARV